MKFFEKINSMYEHYKQAESKRENSSLLPSQELPPEPEPLELTSPDSLSLSIFSSLNSPSPSTCFHCGSVILPGVPCGYCNRNSCYCCGSKDFWKSKAGRVICRVCHPPAPGAEEVEQKGTGNIAA